MTTQLCSRRISYNKTFLTGHLTGLTVPCEFTAYTAKMVKDCKKVLLGRTPSNPGTECTDASVKYYVTDVWVS